MNPTLELTTQIITAVNRVVRAVEIYKPVAVVGLFSGGHDSLSATYIGHLSNLMTKVVHINTGIGIERTRQFVYDTCLKHHWDLLEVKATENTTAKGVADPQNYEDIVMKHGFPGPASHGYMYARLKERGLRRVARHFLANTRTKVKRRVMLISGVRSVESTRRMGHVSEIQEDGRFVWVSPIHDWTKLDTTKLIDIYNLERNPVVDLIHKSGECLCGAYAKPGELEELRLWDETRPAYERIKALEARVKPIHGWGWEESPKRKGPSGGKLGILCAGCKNGESS